MNNATAENTFALPHLPEYEHTQRAPLYWLMLLPGLGVMALAVVAAQDAGATFVMLLASAVLLLTAYSFRQILVCDEGAMLAVRFGPIPLFRKRIAYADIASAERDRTSMIDGWGIHWVPVRGWTYNLWGFDCVRVTLHNGRTYRIGTDDPDALARFLQKKLQPGEA
jgi:hypothetical protein